MSCRPNRERGRGSLLLGYAESVSADVSPGYNSSRIEDPVTPPSQVSAVVVLFVFWVFDAVVLIDSARVRVASSEFAAAVFLSLLALLPPLLLAIAELLRRSVDAASRAVQILRMAAALSLLPITLFVMFMIFAVLVSPF